MIEATCLIAATCRSVGEYLPRSLPTLEAIGALFTSARYVFVENNSTDTTVEQLLAFQTRLGHARVEVLALGDLAAEIPQRTARLAHCRNLVLDRTAGADYLLWVDVDDRLGYPFDTQGLLSCFAYSNWTMMSANQPSYYYDLWALRRPGFNYDVFAWQRDLAARVGPMRASLCVYATLFYHSLVARQHPAAPPVPVYSAFGGMAIYDTKAIRPCCRYVGVDASGHEVCEHVAFNACLHSHAPSTLYINPWMVNS